MIRLHAFPQLARPVLLVGLLLGDGLCGGQRVLLQRLGGLQLARVEGLDALTQLLLALLQGYHCRGQAKLTDYSTTLWRPFRTSFPGRLARSPPRPLRTVEATIQGTCINLRYLPSNHSTHSSYK